MPTGKRPDKRGRRSAADGEPLRSYEEHRFRRGAISPEELVSYARSGDSDAARELLLWAACWLKGLEVPAKEQPVLNFLVAAMDEAQWTGDLNKELGLRRKPKSLGRPAYTYRQRSRDEGIVTAVFVRTELKGESKAKAVEAVAEGMAKERGSGGNVSGVWDVLRRGAGFWRSLKAAFEREVQWKVRCGLTEEQAGKAVADEWTSRKVVRATMGGRFVRKGLR